MRVLVVSDPLFAQHDPGAGHPERPERLDAVVAGARAAARHIVDGEVDIEDVAAGGSAKFTRVATRSELERVHTSAYLDALEDLSARGGGRIDGDTAMGPGSWAAAIRAAGVGMAGVDVLREGGAASVFFAVRPPGHHAVRATGMGFCLLNNVAVVAAELVASGERVLIVDWDADHGNGTQDIFYRSAEVLYVSVHESPLYPGTGAFVERGEGAGSGTTLNVPLPAGATGDVFLRAFDEVIAPTVAEFAPTWVLVSAGFDAHRSDPLTGLALSAGDFADLTARVVEWAPVGRLMFFLEGGYDLDALRDSVTATVSALAGGSQRPERATSGGPGMDHLHRYLPRD